MQKKITKNRSLFLIATGLSWAVFIGFISFWGWSKPKNFLSGWHSIPTVGLAVQEKDFKEHIPDLFSVQPQYLILNFSDLRSNPDRHEEHVRNRIWQMDPMEIMNLSEFPKMSPKDVVLFTETSKRVDPRFVQMWVSFFNQNGELYFLVNEFSKENWSQSLKSLIPNRVLKGHTFQEKEMIPFQPTLWVNRITRAARIRSVQIISIPFSPSGSVDQNVNFILNAKRDLSKISNLDIPKPFLEGFDRPLGYPVVQNSLIFFVAFITPVLISIFLKYFNGKNPGILLGSIIFILLLVGTSIQILGSHPGHLIGLNPIRGLKILLVVPFLISFCILNFQKGAMKSFQLWAKWPWVLGFLLVFLGVYVMRSGNFPLIPVGDWERHFRDALESFFGIRPRFKEFFIGYPLLITGLWLRRKGPNPWANFIMSLGMVGPISVLNTFCHTHTPFILNVTRTVCGVLIGAFISVPYCFLAEKLIRNKKHENQ